MSLVSLIPLIVAGVATADEGDWTTDVLDEVRRVTGATTVEMIETHEYPHHELGVSYGLAKILADGQRFTVEMNLDTRIISLTGRQAEQDLATHLAQLPPEYIKMSRELRMEIQELYGYAPTRTDVLQDPRVVELAFLTSDAGLPVAERAMEDAGATKLRSYDGDLVNFVAGEAPLTVAFDLALHPDVGEVWFDPIPTESVLEVDDDQGSPGTPTTDNPTVDDHPFVAVSTELAGSIPAVNIDDLHPFSPWFATGFNGDVGILDSGYRNHDYINSFAGGQDFTDCPGDGYTSTTDDTNGHGTHVAGIVNAHSHANNLLGASPHGQIYAAKVTGGGCAGGAQSTYIAGADWLQNQGVNILTISLLAPGVIPDGDSQLERFVDAMVDVRGIPWFKSAGNGGSCNGSGGDTSDVRVTAPAGAYNIMAVANYQDWNWARSCTSSYGETPDGRRAVRLAAPGSSIVSTSNNCATCTETMSGTSMAAPHAAGLANAMYDYSVKQSLGWSAQIARAHMLNSAVRLAGWDRCHAGADCDPLDWYQGAGRIDGVTLMSEYTNPNNDYVAILSNSNPDRSFKIPINNVPTEFRATAVWDRNCSYTTTSTPSCNGVTDTDLRLYKADGTHLESDIDIENNLAEVSWTITDPGDYIVHLDLFLLGSGMSSERTTVAFSHPFSTFSQSPPSFDTTPPPAPVISSPTHTEGAWSNNNDPTFTWPTPSDASGIQGYGEFLSSGTGAPATTIDLSGNSRSYTNLADGTWYYNLRARDRAFNWGPHDSFGPVRIDTVDPILDVTVSPAAPNGDNGWYVSNVQVSWTCTDGASGVGSMTRQVDGGAIIGVPASSAYTFSVNGMRSINLVCTDFAGNQVSELVTVDLDSFDPTTGLSLTPASPNGLNGWYVTPPQPTLDCADSTSGCALTTYQLNGGPQQTVNMWPFDTAVPGDGLNTLKAWSTDVAGNEEPDPSISWKVDSLAPATTLSIAGTPGDNGWWIGSVDLTLLCNDGATPPTRSGCDKTEFRVDGGAWQTYSGPVAIGGDGAHIVCFRSTDVAGNQESISCESLRIYRSALKWWLRAVEHPTQPDYLMMQRDTMATGEVATMVAIGAGECAQWASNEAAAFNVDFTPGLWVGNMEADPGTAMGRPSYPSGVGALESGALTMPIGSGDTLFGFGTPGNVGTTEVNSPAFTVAQNGHVVFELCNPTGETLRILTDGQSWVRAAEGSDPFPTPELPGLVLTALGLLGVLAIGARRRFGK